MGLDGWIDAQFIVALASRDLYLIPRDLVGWTHWYIACCRPGDISWGPGVDRLVYGELTAPYLIWLRGDLVLQID